MLTKWCSSHVWLFDGAEAGKFIEDVEAAFPTKPSGTRTGTPASDASTESRVLKRSKGGL